jgi:heptosyltransferase-2
MLRHRYLGVQANSEGPKLIVASRNLAVVQPLPGIGDMIWHLPHIRALAGQASGRVTLVAKPRSYADQIFSGDRSIDDVLWMDRNPGGRRGRHDGSGGLLRFIAELRSRAFDAVVLLHHSRTLAFAVMSAGIPYRYGYGFTVQRYFLNRPPFLPGHVLRQHPYDQACAYLAAARIRLTEPEPRLLVSPSARMSVLKKLPGCQNPLVAIGIGSSEPYKQWCVTAFADLTVRLLEAGWPSIVLVSGRAESELASAIQRLVGDKADRVTSALGWNIGEVAALLERAALFVGNDTSAMNIAAAVGTRAFGIFGATPPVVHSQNLVPIVPPDFRPNKADGMARITVDRVLQVMVADLRSLAPEALSGPQWPRPSAGVPPGHPDQCDANSCL